jgi:hypothetical protein
MREVSIRFRDTKSISKIRNLANRHDIPMTKFVMRAIDNFGKENSNKNKCKILQDRIEELEISSDKYKNLYQLALNELESLKNLYPEAEVNSFMTQLSVLCNGSFTITINEHKDNYNAHTLEYDSPRRFYFRPELFSNYGYCNTEIDYDIIDAMDDNDITIKLEGYHDGKLFRVFHANLPDLLQSAIALINDKQNI